MCRQDVPFKKNVLLWVKFKVCPEAKALFVSLIYNTIFNCFLLFLLLFSTHSRHTGYAHKRQRQQISIYSSYDAAVAFTLHLTFLALYFIQMFFPQISCRCLSVWRFHFAAVKVPKKRQARRRQREREREKVAKTPPLPYAPLAAPLCEDLTRRCRCLCLLRLQFEFSCPTICGSTTCCLVRAREIFQWPLGSSSRPNLRAFLLLTLCRCAKPKPAAGQPLVMSPVPSENPQYRPAKSNF